MPFATRYESQMSFFLKRAVDDAHRSARAVGKSVESPRQPGPIALVGGTLIDVTGKPATPDSVVVVQKAIALSPPAHVHRSKFRTMPK